MVETEEVLVEVVVVVLGEEDGMALKIVAGIETPLGTTGAETILMVSMKIKTVIMLILINTDFRHQRTIAIVAWIAVSPATLKVKAGLNLGPSLLDLCRHQEAQALLGGQDSTEEFQRALIEFRISMLPHLKQLKTLIAV